MTPQEFILRIVKAYQDARIPHQVNEKIRRGRSHSISSITEDLFAYYLISNDPSIEMVYVDQPINLKSAKRQIYPDVAIVRNGVLTAFIDLKMDIGWNRDGLFELCEKHQHSVQQARGTECQIRDGETKELRTLAISDDINYCVVMISRTNINPVTLDRQLEEVKVLSPDVEVFVLCTTGHPNAYGMEPEDIVEGLGIDVLEFERLKEKIK